MKLMKVDRRTLSLVMLAILLSSLITIPVMAQDITVSTDKAVYAPDELYTLSGVTTANAWVSIDVRNPLDTSLFLHSEQADSLGNYEVTRRLPVDAMEGTYTVYASITGASTSTTFAVSLVPTGDTGTLIVDTTPVKGEVFVDGTSWGTAPQTRVLAVGDYTVSYGAMTGYVTPTTVVATVSADETGEAIGTYVLIPTGDTGTLSISTTPVSGEVFVNLASWGTDPLPRVIPVGTYTVSYGAVSGYTKPSPVSATVTKDTVTTKTGTYKVITTGDGFSADNIDITNDNKAALGDAGEKGHTIILEGAPGSVASGYEISVNWDKIQSWDGVKGHLNTTDVDDDGGFEIWFKVPEAPVGTHYLWFTATDQETKVSMEFTVISDCDVSTASGLAGSKIYVDLWGFAKNKDVAILFVEQGTAGHPATDWNQGRFEVTYENLEETVDPDEDDYDGTLANEMIEPGTFVLNIGTNTFDDNSKGKLYSAYAESCGSINYVTGDWSIDLGDTAATETGVFSAEYEYFDDIPNHCYVITATGVTDDLGTWEDRRITIPDDAEEKQYYVVGMDGKNNQAYDDFNIGATITLSTDEGDVGDKITVEGEGFPSEVELTCELWKGNAKVSDVHIIGSEDTTGADDDETDDDGEFEFDIIVPGVTKKDDDYEIKVLTPGTEAAADFEVTGLADVSADPGFGPQGSSIKVSGKNFQNIKDSKVKIMLYDGTAYVADIKTSIKVDSDGGFEATCTVPTENDGPYKIKVASIADDDGDFYLSDTVEFRIGTIMVLLSDDESVVGDRIVLTGNGFTDDGEWNATFGDVTIFSEEQASDTGLLRVGSDTPQFFVPQVQPGVYTITVWDVDAEISVETDFTVTEYTVLDFELLDAPNEFNVSIAGWNWPEVDGDVNDVDEIEFVLFNETDDWEMDILQYGPHVKSPNVNPDDRSRNAAVLNATGFLNDAWWLVPDSDTLSKGKYWVNATIETDNDQEYLMQLEFVIGDIHLYSSPRKQTFRIEETVSFKIQHTFGNDKAQDIWGGDIKVYDPDGTLYWDGDPLKTWSKVETWYECPTSSQMASQNPMVLLDDAPLGTWTYRWRDSDGEVITEGVFNVEASEADIFGGQIDDLNQAIDDLTDDITGVTDAIAGVQSNVQSAIQASQAAVDAANKAIEAVNAVAGTAGEAAEAANKAAEAAGKAQDAASGLTTLVYGAIGASLVAALAAIVSLMQISKRIAG